MSAATSDFSEIFELQQYRKLYEEQEEKTQLKLAERDARITELEKRLSAERERLNQMEEDAGDLRRQLAKQQTEYQRLRQEAQEKIDKLADRIKQLNRQLIET